MTCQVYIKKTKEYISDGFGSIFTEIANKIGVGWDIELYNPWEDKKFVYNNVVFNHHKGTVNIIKSENKKYDQLLYELRTGTGDLIDEHQDPNITILDFERNKSSIYYWNSKKSVCKSNKLVYVDGIVNKIGEPWLDGSRDYMNIVIKNLKNHRKVKLLLEDDNAISNNFEKGDYIKAIGFFQIFPKEERIYAPAIWHDLIDKGQENEIQNENNRSSPEYTQWRNSILTRDNSKCIVCGETEKPHVQHIFGYKDYPDLQLDKKNAVVLCRWCHNKYHDLYGKKSSPRSFIGFLKKYGSGFFNE